MLAIQRKISQYNYYKGNDIKYIIIHYVGANSTAKNNVDYFFGGDRQASAHYFVDDNSIWQSVEDFNGAWHIGNSVTEPNNKNSIGIEMCLVNGVVTAKTEANTLDLVTYLMKKYNVPLQNIRTHAEVTKYMKICPNWSDNNWERWTNFKWQIQVTLNAGIQEEKKVKGIVLYNGEVDRRAAEYLADFLVLPTMPAGKTFDFSTIDKKGIYAVGGKRSDYTSYLLDENFIAGPDRYETIKSVLKRIGKL